MNENDDLLEFLVEGLVGKQRDLVTRAFYYYAEGEAAKKIAEATENTKTNSQSTKEIVSTLANAAGFNWLSVGVTIGFILTLVAMQLPWYWALALFALAVGVIQALGRFFWAAIRERTESIKPG
jgi:hypothetical protein